MNILQGYCFLALTPYIQLLTFYIYYTLKLVKLQILVQHFQCWCYSYPTSTCLTTNTLTSARVMSVLTHFIKYMLGVFLKAYKECDDRFYLIGKEKLTSAERVFSVIQKSLGPLSKKDIMILCPNISQRTIERALKELQDNEKIKQVGSGRSTKYIKI